MSDADRRDFLKKLAATTAYAAPVIRTLAAPDPAAAQNLSKKEMMGMGFLRTRFDQKGPRQGPDQPRKWPPTTADTARMSGR